MHYIKMIIQNLIIIRLCLLQKSFLEQGINYAMQVNSFNVLIESDKKEDKIIPSFTIYSTSLADIRMKIGHL